MKVKKNPANRLAPILGFLAMALLLAACGIPLDEQKSTHASATASVAAGLAAAERATERAERAASLHLSTVTPTSQVQAIEAATPGARPWATSVGPAPTPIAGLPPAPDFRLPDLEGNMWTLSQFRGQPVMLFYWATW